MDLTKAGDGWYKALHLITQYHELREKKIIIRANRKRDYRCLLRMAYSTKGPIPNRSNSAIRL